MPRWNVEKQNKFFRARVFLFSGSLEKSSPRSLGIEVWGFLQTREKKDLISDEIMS